MRYNSNMIKTSSPYVPLLQQATAADATSEGVTRDMYAITMLQSSGADASNTFDVEASLDGVSWIKIGSTISSDTITVITVPYRFLRAVRKTGQPDHELSVFLYSADRLRA